MRTEAWLDYDVVDVFTDRPFAGNQLAVVHGATGLATDQLQALAREFGYSETTFPEVLPGGAAAGEYAVRIFTPGQEIPFAGHPTLGTAWVLRDRGWLPEDYLVQVCGAGRIQVRVGGTAGQELVELTAEPRDLAGPLDAGIVGELLGLVGLGPDDVAGPVWVAGCGLSFVHLPVTEEAVLRAVPTSVEATDLFARVVAATGARDLLDALNICCVTGSSPTLAVHSRVFVPGVGVPEDPATGSAAAGLGLALVASGRLPEGGRYDIRQGVEMGRPSALRGHVEVRDGVAVRSHVAGQVQPIARGRIRVPRDGR